MPDLLTIKAYINSCSKDFLDYLKVYVIDDESFEVLKQISDESEVYIFCGVIRDYFLGRYGNIRDLDFVIKEPIKRNPTYIKFFRERFSTFRVNSFGGFKLIDKNGPNVDLWQLGNTWGIVNRNINVPTPNALIDSVFFNFSAITFDFKNKKFIFNDNFANFLLNKVIDIVYEENPNVPLCLFNLFYYNKILNLPLADKSRNWIRTHLHECDDFDSVQKKHLGKVKYSNIEIKKFLKRQTDMTKIYGINWDKYLSADREKVTDIKRTEDGTDKRTPFESDFGRVVFSSAMRRMHDKTQVIPLTSGDKIHTRLTHSMEVMNTAQSLAFNLCRDKDFVNEYGKEKAYQLERDINVILKTAAFVHDIGNPPFGHFGETVIKNYFKNYLNNHILCDRNKLDFEEFDGNAQGFRILTHLSYIGYLSGLNLTYATLGAYLKYPNADAPDKSYIGTKKHGIFVTEEDVFNHVVSACNLKREDGKIKRHPLSFLVEAADSICYNVMDIEDGYLLHWYDKDDIIRYLDSCVTEQIQNYLDSVMKSSFEDLKTKSLIYNEFYDVERKVYSFVKIITNKKYSELKSGRNRVHWIMDFRVKLIQYLVELATKNFKIHAQEIDNGTYSKELIEDDPFFVTKALQKFTARFIFPQHDIQRAELTGHSVINGLFDILLNYISSNDEQFRKRVKNIISKSAIRVAIHEKERGDYMVVSEDDFFNYDLASLSENAKLRLIVDFVSGMTDKFAVMLYQQLSGLKV